ncbi:hypothetical protein L6164_003478 [Bauhinia variegata]|uniref:Uncharacterized protein n=1 Tax=Bauhinia variegata TaxID=167791 RepID=A0ACB9Q0L2_BAUVA|nr:hypothetical protein L6164_003478 [Bauhinia variegata]
MASENEPMFPLKLLVDKERNHVVVAEATGDFVDILFSFLTLPLATIIRLISKKPPAAEIGCIGNLYNSVEYFDTDDFWNHICKQMLLCPRNPCDALCQKLKLNLEYDKEPMKYFMCSSCRGNKNDWLLSTFAETTCTCGKLMNQEMKLEDSIEEVDQVNGVFVKGEAMYLIFDDLKVMKGSLSNSLQHLIQLGYKDLSNLIDISPKVGLNEILDLLKQALTSKSPLTGTFLANVESKPMEPFCPQLGAKLEARNCKMNLKITVSKSNNKILYAEVDEDFIDFLLSFLTIPLGSILNLLDGNSSVGCIDNLYRSVESLNPWCQASCTLLLDPRVAPQFGCQNQPLNMAEQDPPFYWFGTGVMYRNHICHSVNKGVISRRRHLIKNPEAMKLFDPRSPDGTKAIGFVKRPAVFAVSDDLRITPLTSNSSIFFLQKLNIPLDDMDRHVVSIGETEALNLLRASLTSKAALTDGLFLLLKKPKEEIN